MTYHKTIKVLVAKNDAGEFLSLDETFATTTPGHVKSPLDAKHIMPWHKEEFENPESAAFYFENSGRMRYWLEGFRMVPVEIKIEATEL